MYRSNTDNCERCKRKSQLIEGYCESCYEDMVRLWIHQSSRTIEDMEYICMNGLCEICNVR